MSRLVPVTMMHTWTSLSSDILSSWAPEQDFVRPLLQRLYVWTWTVARALLWPRPPPIRAAEIANDGDAENRGDPTLHITGLATAWPPSVFDTDRFETWIRSRYDADASGIKRIIRLNKQTGIEKRHVVMPVEPLWQDKTSPPTFDQVDAKFREHATKLVVDACKSAIAEWNGRVEDITHVVAVTCTSAGSPGYDLEIAVQLGLSLDVERTLLHGVGCAGGLSALRTAAQLAKSCGNQPANILVFACEIPSLHAHPDLRDAETNPETSIGSILFSDGAAALVLSNPAARMQMQASDSIYRLLDCNTRRVPKTESLMSYYGTQLGFRLDLSREVPMQAAHAIPQAFKRISHAFVKGDDGEAASKWLDRSPSPTACDWALHPGGLSIIKGAEIAAGISNDHLRASYDVYKNRGNTSSVAVLAVLDRLRQMGPGRENVVAMSFGPGLIVESAALQRCRP